MSPLLLAVPPEPEEEFVNRDLSDLRESLHALDLVFFDGHLGDANVAVKWMRWKKATVSHEFVYATYLQNVIQINRALAWHWVPEYVVMATLYHEALHHIVGMDHDLAFTFAEQRYPHFAASQVWEAHNIQKLLSAPRPF